jgi:hypothetical protein
MNVSEFARRYGSTVEDVTLELINRMDLGEPVQAGRSYKVVTGEYAP